MLKTAHGRRTSGFAAAVVVGAVLVLGGVFSWPGDAWGDAAGAVSDDPSGEDGSGVFADAWERANDTGSYRFRGDVEQVQQPSGNVLNAGKPAKVDRLHLEGDANLNDSAMQFEVWAGGGSLVTDEANLAVSVADGVTSQRVRGGDWEPSDDATSLIAPDGDFLSYLLAARDVVPIGTQMRGGQAITRYQFTVDGPAFATSMAAQANETLRARGELPPGAQVVEAAHYRDMTGSGELWVDADGLPVRQSLQLQFPEQGGQRVSADIAIDFFDYGYAPHTNGVSTMGLLVVRFVAIAAAVVLGVAMFVVAHRRRPRAVRRMTVVLVSASLFTSTLVVAASAAPARVSAASVTPSATEVPSDASALLRQVASAPLGSDPHQSSLTRVTAATSNSLAPDAVTETADTGADADGDGLSDFIEGQLGTDPNNIDTDNDALTDDAEVNGSTDGDGVAWYTDPLVNDTNHDGIADGLEWDTDNNGVPDDTDGDGVPDVFDDDNDGDGVPDNKDLNAFASGGIVFGADQPLGLRIDGMTTTEPMPTFVDFQLRPVDQTHLTFALSSLDWPSDTEGQIRDVDNGTNDVRVVPMLEVQIPAGTFDLYSQEELEPYAISLGDEREDGSRTAYLPLNLVTDETSGDRVAFSGRMLYPSQQWGVDDHDVRLVWTVQVNNDVPCDPDAEPAEPGCSSSGYIYNVPQNVHRYYEDWTLTGLKVSEAHGATMALIDEDPVVDLDLHDAGPTWVLAQVLSERFLTADPSKEGTDSFAINPGNIDSLLDRDLNGGGPTSIYGQPNVFQVHTDSYPTFEEAVIDTSSVQVPDILNSRYDGYWSGPDSLRPSVLMAYTNTTRALTLDALRATGGYATLNGPAIKLDLAPAGQTAISIDTLGGIKWTEFCGGEGDEPLWTGCTAEQTLSNLDERNGDVLLDPDDLSPTNTLDPAIAAGENVWMSIYAMTLAQGMTALLMQDFGSGAVISNQFDFESDAAVSARILDLYESYGFYASSTSGFSKFIANKIFFTSIIDGGLFGPATEQIAAARSIKQIQNGLGSTLFTAFLVVAVIAMAVLAVFYFLGDEGAQLTVTVLSVLLPAITSVGFPLYTLYSLFRAGGILAGLPFSAVTGEMLGTTRIAAAAAVIIGLVVTWGFFLYAVISSDVPVFSAAFNAALATSIASTILIVMIGILALTGIGLILVGILTVIDGIFLLICELGSDTDEGRLRTDFTDGGCFTLTGAMTKIITTFLYNYELMIDVERDDLIDTGLPDFELAEEGLGYSVGNSMTVSLPVTTNARLANASASSLLILPYQWLYSRSNLRSSTFEYSITSPGPETLSPERGTMSSSWSEPVPTQRWLAHQMYATSRTQDVPGTPLEFDEAGLNRSFDLVFNVGMALPATECWNLPLPLPPLFLPICYIRTFSDSSSTALDPVVYDVFPEHLSGLVEVVSLPNNRQRFAWDDAFAPLADADGDGALALEAGGLDPDDRTTDLDRDGLTDAFELQQRQNGSAMDPSFWDTDLDGLTDRQEWQLGTNPAVADTDNDGLDDGVEVRHQQYELINDVPTWNGTFVGGCTVDVPGMWNLSTVSTRTVWVSSDPLRADSDFDGISDAAECQLADSDDPTDRVDEAGRAFSPATANVSPLTVSLSSDDGDGYVSLGQEVMVRSEATANRPMESAVLDLTVPSPGTAPEPAALPFDPDTFTGSQTATSDLEVTIAQAAAEDFTVTSDVRARLESSPTRPVEWTIAPETPIASTRQYATADVTTRRADLANAYLITDGSSTFSGAEGAGDVRVITIPGGNQRSLDRDTEPVGSQRADYRYLRGSDAPGSACNTSGDCLTVWDHVDNCSVLTLQSLRVVVGDESGSSGIEPGVYLQRAAGEPYELLWFPQFNGGNDMGDGAQRGPNGNGFPDDITFCGTAKLFIEEVDGNAVTRDSNESLQLSVYPSGSDGVSQGNFFEIDASQPLSNTVKSYSSADYRETRSGIQECWYVGYWCQRVDLTFSVQPRPARRVAAALSSATAVEKSQFQLPTGMIGTAVAEDYGPDVASDGSGFAIVSERYALPGTSEHRDVVLTRYDPSGTRLDEIVLAEFRRDSPSGVRHAKLAVEWATGEWWVLMVDPAYSSEVRRFRVAADLSTSVEDVLVYDSALVVPSMTYDPTTDRSLLVYQGNADRNVWGVLYPGSSSVELSEPVALLVGSDDDIRRPGCLFDAAPQAVVNPLTGGWLVTAPCEGTLRVVSTDSLLTSVSSRTMSTSSVRSYDVACPSTLALPAVDLRFDELPGTTTFVDSSPEGRDATSADGSAPAAGYLGAPGAAGSDHAVSFNGTGDVASLANPADEGAVSLAFWYRNTNPLVGQPFALRGSGADPYALEIDPATGALQWNTRLAATTGLADGDWHFVTVTRSAVGTLAVYVDGVLTTTTTATPGALAPNVPGRLDIEGGAGTVLVDHLRVFATDLKTEAVVALYERTEQQVCVSVASVSAASASEQASIEWARHQFVAPDTRGGRLSASATLSLRVDTDQPSSSISLGADAIRGAAGAPIPYMIGGVAGDATSGVDRVEVSIDGGPWQVADGAESWTFTVEVTNGDYSIRSRAVDAVGNEELPGEPVVLVVDGAAPTVVLSAPSVLAVRPGIDPDTDRPTATLAGTVSDVGSGVATDGVEVQLLLADDTVRDTGWQKATVDGDNWSIGYVFSTSASDVSNTYSVRVRAVDRAGNETADDAASGTLRLDSAAPVVALDAESVQMDVLAGTPGNGGFPELTGTVNDDGGSGIKDLSVAFVPADASPDDRSDLTWYPADLASSGEGVAVTTWRVAAPPGLEGLYHMSVRTSDEAGNDRERDEVWSGVVDTTAPRLDLDVVPAPDVFGDGLTFSFDVYCRADDVFLSEQDFSCPGEALESPRRSYATDNAPFAELFPDLPLLQSLDILYRSYESTATPLITLSACDLYGNCSTTTGPVIASAAARSRAARRAAAGVGELFVAVSAPRNGQHVALASGTVPVQINARAATGETLTSVVVKVDGVAVAWPSVVAGATSLRAVVAVPVTVGERMVVVAVNGIDSEPVTFFADGSAPSLTLDATGSGPDGAWVAASDVVRFAGTVGDDGEVVRVRVRVDNGPWFDAIIDVTPGTAGTWRTAIPVADPDGRALSIEVRAIDRAGRLTNVSGISRIDLAPVGVDRPDTEIDSGPTVTSTSTSATFEFQGVDGTKPVAGFSCRVDQGASQPCASPWTVDDLSAATHQLEVTALDTDGLEDLTPAIWRWTVIASGARAELTAQPADPSDSTTATFAFRGPLGASFRCSLDGVEFTPCSTPVSYADLVTGAHSFKVAAVVDGVAGSPQEHRWTVVDAPPVARNAGIFVETNSIGRPVTLIATDTGTVAYRVTRQPRHGYLSGTAPLLTYVPDSGYVGPDSFRFVADDTQSVSNEATISVTVATAQPSLTSQRLGFEPVQPTRLIDTRERATLTRGSILEVKVTGRGRAPRDAEAVALSVTAVDAVESGFLTVFSCGSRRPRTSNLYYSGGQTVTNAVTVGVGRTPPNSVSVRNRGRVCLFASTSTDVIVDLNGYWSLTGTGLFAPITPNRLVDTRNGKRARSGSITAIDLTGTVPPDASSVIVNVMADMPQGSGYLTLFPCSAARPVASHLTFTAGATVSASTVIGQGSDAKVCVFTSRTTDLVVDVTGWFGPMGTAALQTIAPTRLVDTQTAGVPAAADSVTRVTVPPSALGAALNVAAVRPFAAGSLTVYPCGDVRPLVPNLDFVPGGTVANQVIVGATSGEICIFTSSRTHLVIDHTATFAKPTIEINRPKLNAVYAQGQVVAAAYSCSDDPGSPRIRRCVGTVASGLPIDTAEVGRKTFAVNATDDSGITQTVTRRYTVALARPDARIKKGKSGPLVGNDDYGQTGQTVVGSARRGTTTTYYVSVRNAALFTDRLTLTGGASAKGFNVRYSNGRGRNITSAITSGIFITPRLTPGATFLVKVEVTARAAARTATLTRSVTATSSTHTDRIDKVTFITNHR
jgi:hypothetical protein